jgi:hypothetical protein
LRKQVVTSAVRRADDLTTVLVPAQRAALVKRRQEADQVGRLCFFELCSCELGWHGLFRLGLCRRCRRGC